MDNNNISYVFGIDIALDSFTTRLVSNEREPKSISKNSETFSNNNKGLSKMLTWIDKQNIDKSKTLFVMEATNTYWESCALYLNNRSLHVCVVNPAKIKYFAKSKLTRSKNDNIDAFVIACYGAVNNPKLWNPPAPLLDELRELSRRLSDLEKNVSQEKNRLRALDKKPIQHNNIINDINEHISFLESKIEELKIIFKEKIAQDKELYDSFNTLNDVKGIGFVTSSVLITETWNFTVFEHKNQLTAYAGMNPCDNQSGSSKKGKSKMSKIGNPRIRSAVYMAALSASVYNDNMNVFYNRLIKNNKTKKVALVAVARKLLVLAFTLVSKKVKYDQNYVSVKPTI